MFNTLNLTSLNVNGLHSKLNLGIVDDYLSKFDLVVLTETLTDDPDLTNSMLLDYKILTMPKSGSNKYGGFLGINVLLRKDIFDNATVIENTKSQSILWLKIEKKVFGVEFIIGAMYLPYEGSKFYSNEIFENLHDDLLLLNLEFNLPICLIGDSNARTGLSDDFINIDQHVADLAGIDTNSEDFCDMKSVLDSIGISTKRFNSDQISNNNGLKLIECCRTFGLRIVNGRFGDDKNIGKFTCYNKNGGKSVVDYILMSDALLPLISAFEVDLFDNCMSDVHCPINLCLRHADDKCINVNKQSTVKPQEVSTCTKKKMKTALMVSVLSGTMKKHPTSLTVLILLLLKTLKMN